MVYSSTFRIKKSHDWLMIFFYDFGFVCGFGFTFSFSFSFFNISLKFELSMYIHTYLRFFLLLFFIFHLNVRICELKMLVIYYENCLCLVKHYHVKWISEYRTCCWGFFLSDNFRYCLLSKLTEHNLVCNTFCHHEQNTYNFHLKIADIPGI